MAYRSSRSHPIRLVACGLVALSLAAASGCGDDAAATPALSADTFCQDFMLQPPADRAAATARVATEIGVPNPTDAQWATELEERCAAAPDLKLGDFFRHFI